MGKCSMSGCSSMSTNKIAMFSIPSDTQIRDKWNEFLRSSGKTVIEGVQYVICENHFRPEDIKLNANRKRLKSGAVPSVFDPNDSDIAMDETRETDSHQELEIALKLKIVDLESKLAHEKKKSRMLMIKLAKHQSTFRQLRKFLKPDQLQAISGKKVQKWSSSSMKKAILIKTKGGSQLLNYVRKHVIPLPCKASICDKLSRLKMKPVAFIEK